MSRTVDRLFTEDELESILQDETVVENLGKISETCKKVRFSIDLSESIRSKLTSIGILSSSMNSLDSLPMSWISGDSQEHIDSGAGDFKETILVYVSDAEGSFIIDNISYQIKKGRAFVFSTGMMHSTIDTGSSPRLLIGPMSETGIPVGGANINYYNNQTDQIDNLNVIYNENHSVPQGAIIASTTTFPNNATIPPSFPGAILLSWAGETNTSNGKVPVTYNLGATWVNDGYDLFLYPVWGSPYRIMCFGEGTQILCLDPEDNTTEKYIAVQDLQKGTLVKTLSSGYKPVCILGHSKIYNPANSLRGKNRLYKCKKEKYPELTDDLILTGCHSILIDIMSDEERADTEEVMGGVFVTENRYRLMACIDQRAEPYEKEGVFPIWHFALEHEHNRANYGVYANGLLVETSSKRMMSEYSGMELI
jgi:hypothetical protein